MIQHIVEAPDLVALHHDLLAILRLHRMALLHRDNQAGLVFHGHLAVLEHIHRGAVLQFVGLGDIDLVGGESRSGDQHGRGGSGDFHQHDLLLVNCVISARTGRVTPCSNQALAFERPWTHARRTPLTTR
ncbi:hypothetical protein ebA2185 [Aromatoleum aromaticum EbN1]|uniref:Uncharacterized protein n=1 Tax=Aromatoleum aromaticum (strain DSM 19018 / LMG 30748 / EbN1) TaxID=76114 RepID=Q5P5T0_AROAE|nr:hypothetical protein ebA2185 [Aromatoleum aromaticum EbN1]